MKLIHIVLAAAVAGVMPVASADERAGPKPFTIAISSEVSPVSHGDVRYPSYAGTRGLEGSCSVSFTISLSGKADAIRVGECSSEAFRGSAKSAVEAMEFAPQATVLDNVRMKIRWSLNETPQLYTASLRQ
jgi:TonB family protein